MGPSGVQKNLKKSLSGFKKFNKRDLNLTKPMEKLMNKNVLNKFGFARIALVASVGFPFIVASNAFAQAAPPPPPGAGAAPAPSAEVERVIVTGSLIPTAEEVGPNPVFS